MGIKFDEITMRKVKFTENIIMTDGRFGMVMDLEGCPAEEFTETSIEQECWVLDQVETEDCDNGYMLFVYIPEYDIATCVLSTHVNGE